MTYPESPLRRHERVAPTWDGVLPLEVSRRPPPLPPKRSGYIAAHWKGELSLAQSYWCNGVLLGFGLRVVESVLMAWIKESHSSLTRLLVVAAVYGAARLAISVWQVVGILRAASLSGSRWAVLVNILMAIAILATVAGLATEVRQLQALARGAAEQRRFNHFSIAPDVAGAAIVAKGSIGTDYADGVADAFAAHPAIHRLILDSVGGDVDNGMRLHDFLAAHPDIVVEVDHVCASACTLAFIGGEQRIVSSDATLGFHQMRSMIDSDASRAYLGDAQEKFKSLLASRGASADFIRLAFAKQGDNFYAPEADSLFANHIITGLRLGGRELTAAQWRMEQFLFAYSLQPRSRPMGEALALIRSQWPSIYDTWVQHNLRIKDEADHDRRVADYNVELWRTLHAARSAAMRTAGSDHVRQFAEDRRALLASLSEHLSADTCGRYLAGEAVDVRDQGDALFIANGRSYVDLLTGNDPGRAVGIDWALGARELAQVRDRIGATMPARAGGQAHATLCRQQIALLDQLLALPGAGSDMALRSLFASAR
ncbi:hypothetical protein ACXU4B_17130 [Dyella soli]|uniref:Uncharacterized protein n=1 Tax=Dyella soli TaxID=522319 RepID=A0A4R0YKF3_9GAMM|nr:hypothetical protein [Dyella soli]TCI06474.1 hypothetical protein EZM97_33890 [Dyella soli]